jgi:magnesium transporter
VSSAQQVAKPKITVHSYNAKEYEVTEIKAYAAINGVLEKAGLIHWIEVQGLGDPELLTYIGSKFGIHELVLEDIGSNYQRPKLDEYDGYLFAANRLIYINEELEIENEQLSFLLLPGILISFQHQHTACLDPAVNLLKGAKGIIRTAGSSYMMYVVIDIIIDTYFSLIYRMGDELDIIEELLYRKPDKSIMYKIQEVKRAMILIRRAAWPQRDMINDIIRSESELITSDTRTFLKDIYDHTMQVVDLVESYKDVTTTLIDTNLAIISNRMNEVMKVLTVISSIFIPLTFIVGVYGMNFAREDPQTGRFLPHNMPELYQPYGYIWVMAAMLLIALAQVVYFHRKGWFR